MQFWTATAVSGLDAVASPVGPAWRPSREGPRVICPAFWASFATTNVLWGLRRVIASLLTHRSVMSFLSGNVTPFIRNHLRCASLCTFRFAPHSSQIDREWQHACRTNTRSFVMRYSNQLRLRTRKGAHSDNPCTSMTSTGHCARQEFATHKQRAALPRPRRDAQVYMAAATVGEPPALIGEWMVRM